MVAGAKNPLTEILETAEGEVEKLDLELASKFGLPLYTEDVGRSPKRALAWPEDPEAISPEEMALLVATRGEDAVNQWLLEHYTALAEKEAFDPEFKGVSRA